MSLLRFKAVCKDWFSLIESWAFISEHTNRTRDNKNDSLIVLGRDNRVSVERKISLLFGNQFEECVYNIYNGQSWPPTADVRLISHCDGIVCLGHEKEIALWNPALKELKPLPQPLFSNRLASSKYYSISTSFGSNVKRNDYKLVRILLLYSDTGDMVGNQVEVYNLGEKSWRIIHKDDVLPFDLIPTFDAVSSAKIGKCFWVARTDDFTPIFLSFDFNDDMFGTMLLPYKNKDLMLAGRIGLDLLDDKVVYIASHKLVRHIEIWVLHEFGVEESWSMMYRVRPLNFGSIYPLRISKNGEFLVCIKSGIAAGEQRLYLYNLYTREGKFQQNCYIDLSSRQLIHYNASLLSLKSAIDVQPGMFSAVKKKEKEKLAHCY